jgi:histidine triad (HIT) family protein
MCIFCKIIAGEIPAHKVYEDEKTFAFLDIKPVHPGHILVVPKKHAANLEEIEEDDLAAVSLTMKKMGKLIKDKLGYEGYNACTNNDPVANQQIPHLHFHLIPRITGDGLNAWVQKAYDEGVAEEILSKLKA